ncbi:MAG: DUF2304 domain-containing protein [Prolixibacteraceae bacterium]|nr:DUF2304 domain-containing protein [Prolixibacteraceae bacterium]
MDRIQVISVAASLLIFVVVINLVRKRKLKTEYSLIWLSVSLVFVVLSIWRRGIDWLASVFGIAYAPSVLFIILLVGIILLLIEFSIIISKQAEKIKVLAQELALFKQEIENKVENKANNETKTTKVSDTKENNIE